MGKYPVTQAQWGALMAVNPSHFSGANRPVENMSFQETQSYIAALNAHIIATGQGPVTMRLPTEAEWEYACRAGTTTRFYFGDSLDCLDHDNDCAAGVLPGNRTDYMWYSVNSGGQTQPVGQKLPNQWGLHDMAGNVQELCQDRIASGNMANYPGGSVTDPTGPLTGDSRVARGGSYMDPTQNCRSANRWGLADIWVRFHTFGFRLAGTI